MKKLLIITGFVVVVLGSSVSVVAADSVNPNSQNGNEISEAAQQNHPTPPVVNPHGDELPFSN